MACFAAACPDGPPPAIDTPARMMVHVASRGLFGDPRADGLTTGAPPQGTSPGANAAGMLIASLIIYGMNESERRANLEARAQVKAVLDKRDIEAEWRNAVALSAANHPRLPSVVVDQVADPLELEQPGLLVRVKEDTIVTLGTRLILLKDLSVAHALTSIRIWRRQQHIPTYCRDILIVSEAALPGESASYWLENNGERLSRFVAEASKLSLGLFALDGGVRSDNAVPGEVQVTIVDPATGKPLTMALRMLEDRDDRLHGYAVIRGREAIVSVPRTGGANERSAR